jgi:hypothetical protein
MSPFLMRPGRRIARAAVGAAVIGGTAAVVNNKMNQHYANQSNAQAQQQDQQQQMADMQAQQQQLAYQQQQLAQQQAMLAQQAQMAQPAPAPQVQVPAPAGGMTDDKIAQLQKLAELQKQGILTPEEFAAQKAKILAS